MQRCRLCLSPGAKRAARVLALALPVLLTLLWSAWIERAEYVQARERVEQRAGRAAASLAARIADRLDTQFTELQFAAVAVLGSQRDAARPDSRAAQMLRRFTAVHRDLYAFNIQSADGNTIVWSTTRQPGRPIVPGDRFTPVQGHPGFLLGAARYAARVGTKVLTMRVRVPGPDGAPGYLVGTPYRLDHLLRLPAALAGRSPWTLVVRDLRDGSVLGTLVRGRVRLAIAQRPGARVRVAVPGFPLAVQASWPAALPGAIYRGSARGRWALEFASAVLLALAAWGLAALLERRSRDADRLRRVACFSALRAEVIRSAQVAEEERGFFDSVCRAGAQLAALRLMWIGSPDGSHRSFEVLAAAGATEYLNRVPISPDPALPGGMGPTGKAWRDNRAVFAQRHASPRVAEPWVSESARHGLGAFAALPLHEHGRVRAVATLYCADIAAWDEESRSLMLDLATQIEQGLDAIRQRRQVANLERIYQALAQAADVLLRGNDEADMLRQACEKLISGTPFHAAWIGKPDESGIFRVLSLAGRGARDLPDIHVSLRDGEQAPLIVRAWAAQHIAFHNDHLADPQLAPWREFLLRHAWHAALAAPVFRGQDLWAVLVFVSPQRGIFDAKTVALCERVSELLGRGLDELDIKRQLSALQREASYQARHDPLTGLPNRVALEQHVGRAIAMARRQQTVLALGMIDLDRFKLVNDRFGHAAGDLLLQRLVARLREELRETDFLGRLGGDEFVVVLEGFGPSAAPAQLRAVLDRLHRAVQAPFDLGQQQVEIGMAMGLALYPGDGQDFATLLVRADAAMYQAKAHKGGSEPWWRLATAPAAGARPEPDSR